jgi:hypothetical protein
MPSRPSVAVAAMLAIAIACTASMTPAQAGDGVTPSSAAGKKHHAKRARPLSDGHQIACTVLGCHPVPRNCHPVTGYNFWGEPTGFDDIVCR